ncbi:MAG: TrkH family potassium uptake protein [Thermoleophilia bacterium]|nr:TrkH family potassium uptake protein [Thermoleophilia bacterium]
MPEHRMGIDARGTVGLVGVLSRYLALSALVPIAVALYYDESIWPFVGAGLGLAAFGTVLRLWGGDISHVGAREGFLVVALVWLVAAVYAALPYLLSGDPQLAGPADALFEGMSGFTTTGATVLTDIEALPQSLLMWRQFTQWLGGMGIIVLALAVLPRLRVGGRQLLESELPGPEVDQLATRIREATTRFSALYLALTALEAGILGILGWTGIDPEMDTFNAIAHAFTTIPTGGFSPQNRSIEPFAPVTQWVILVFMIAGGVNFALLFQVFVRRRLRVVLRDEELRAYGFALLAAAAILTAEIWTKRPEIGEEAIRVGFFQAASILTTTGYATVDFALWPTLALVTLVGLMFVGASAGSTSGSVKVLRHVLMAKILGRELRQTVHPELVAPIRLNRVVVDERTLRAVMSFVLLYIGIFVAGTLVITIDAAYNGPTVTPFEAIGVVAATLGNVGPAVGFAGPFGSYAPFSDVSTVALTTLMWIGRIEVIPVVVLLTRSYWRS